MLQPEWLKGLLLELIEDPRCVLPELSNQELVQLVRAMAILAVSEPGAEVSAAVFAL